MLGFAGMYTFYADIEALVQKNGTTLTKVSS